MVACPAKTDSSALRTTGPPSDQAGCEYLYAVHYASRSALPPPVGSTQTFANAAADAERSKMAYQRADHRTVKGQDRRSAAFSATYHDGRASTLFAAYGPSTATPKRSERAPRQPC